MFSCFMRQTLVFIFVWQKYLLSSFIYCTFPHSYLNHPCRDWVHNRDWLLIIGFSRLIMNVDVNPWSLSFFCCLFYMIWYCQFLVPVADKWVLEAPLGQQIASIVFSEPAAQHKRCFVILFRKDWFVSVQNHFPPPGGALTSSIIT